jgi:hypothetical protein
VVFGLPQNPTAITLRQRRNATTFISLERIMEKRWLCLGLTVLLFFPALYLSGWIGVLCVLSFIAAFLSTWWFFLVDRIANVSQAEPILLPSAQELLAMKQAELARQHSLSTQNVAQAAPKAQVVAPPVAATPPKPTAPITGRAVFNLGTDATSE